MAEVLHPGRFTTFESLRLRDYRLLWLGQLTTSMGQWMDQTARSWLIYTLTGSPLQLGLASASRGVPLLLFGVVAGVVADRYGRKKQLIISQVVNAVINVVLATLILLKRIEPWHVYLTGFIAGTVQAFQQPARQVLVNDLVGHRYLTNAVALNSAAFNVSRSLGPAVCGLLIHAFGVDVSYYVQAGFFAFATLWTGQIRVPARNPNDAQGGRERGSLLASAGEGFAYILSNRMIRSLMTLGLAPILLGMPYTSLMPIFAIDVLGGDASTQGLLLTTVGAGAVAGALTVASLSRRRQGNGRLLVMGAAGFGLALILFARSPVLWMMMIFAFAAGLTNSAYTSQNQTLLQMLTPDRLRGRVLGTYMLNRGLMPAGSMIAGALASALGGPWAVAIMGASCLLVAAGVAAAAPELWRLRGVRHAADPRAAA